jgi:soluble P-type ATPase
MWYTFIMIEIKVPGYGHYQLEHLVLDYNGTLACDGQVLAGVKEALRALSDRLEIHVLTAGTFGRARSELQGIPCQLSILAAERQDAAKLAYVKGLNPARTVCIGNGRIDRLMLQEAALGMAVVQEEGAAVEALLAADVVCTSIVSALALLLHPKRLVATLRS